jgi:deoxyadenosine/deoxycytidine kinase
MSNTASHTLVEITGVAGSGKSTVTSILIRGRFARATFISARDPKQLSLFLRCLPRLGRLIVENLRRRPRMTWADFKLMVYISTWDTHLSKVASEDPLVFDQGPLYALVRLRAQGIGVASTPAFSRWWSEMLSKWLDQISLVVLLDARDDALIERLNMREQEHDLKGADLNHGREFLSRYRTLFEEIGSEIERLEKPTLHRVDTGRIRADEVARMVEDAVSQRREHAP